MYETQVVKGNWYIFADKHGSEYILPEEVKSEAGSDSLVEGPTEGYCVRLSAPGYLDCTEWEGIFTEVDDAWSAAGDLEESIKDDLDTCSLCTGTGIPQHGPPDVGWCSQCKGTGIDPYRDDYY